MVQILNDLTEEGADDKRVTQHEDRIRYRDRAPGGQLEPAYTVCVWRGVKWCICVHVHVLIDLKVSNHLV